MELNGEHVSRAELRATVEPMQNDITEIKQDVKSLLLYNAGQVAVEATTKDWGARKLAMGGLVVYVFSLALGIATFAHAL